MRPEEMYGSVHAAYAAARARAPASASCGGGSSTEDAAHAQNVMHYVRATLQIENSVRTASLSVPVAQRSSQSGGLEEAFPRTRPRAVHTFASAEPLDMPEETSGAPAACCEGVRRGRCARTSSSDWGGGLGDILPSRAQQVGACTGRCLPTFGGGCPQEAAPESSSQGSRLRRAQEGSFGASSLEEVLASSSSRRRAPCSSCATDGESHYRVGGGASRAGDGSAGACDAPAREMWARRQQLEEAVWDGGLGDVLAAPRVVHRGSGQQVGLCECRDTSAERAPQPRARGLPVSADEWGGGLGDVLPRATPPARAPPRASSSRTTRTPDLRNRPSISVLSRSHLLWSHPHEPIPHSPRAHIPQRAHLSHSSFGSVRFGSVRFGSVRFHLIPLDSIRVNPLPLLLLFSLPTPPPTHPSPILLIIHPATQPPIHPPTSSYLHLLTHPPTQAPPILHYYSRLLCRCQGPPRKLTLASKSVSPPLTPHRLPSTT